MAICVAVGILIHILLVTFFDKMEDYLSILQVLQREGVQYCVIGTWALKVYFPQEMKDYVLRDCDIVLSSSINNLHKAISVLKQENWQVTLWNEPIPLEANDTFFLGKYYIRAKKEDFVLDLTYEPKISWKELATSISYVLDIPLASIEHILILKRKKAIDAGTLDAFQNFLKRLPSSLDVSYS